MKLKTILLIGLLTATSGAALAAAPEGPKLTLSERRQMRFPQPVLVGRLTGEYVVDHGVTLRRLGKVVGVFKDDAGDLSMVFRYGAVFGLGGRLIAPPLEELSLVGPMVKINELDQKDLAALPTFTGGGGAFLKSSETIFMGVDRKY